MNALEIRELSYNSSKSFSVKADIDLFKFHEHCVMRYITIWLIFFVTGCLLVVNYLINIGVVIF